MSGAMAYKIIDNDYDRLQKHWTAFVGYEASMQTMIGLERDGQIICVFGYNNFNGKSCHQHIIYKEGEYVPRNYVWFVYYYPFNQMGVDVLIGMTPSDNKKALRLAKHAGFIEQCTIKGAAMDGDLVVSSLKKEECRFLNYSKGY